MARMAIKLNQMTNENLGENILQLISQKKISLKYKVPVNQY